MIPQTRSLNPETQNPRPETRDPKPASSPPIQSPPMNIVLIGYRGSGKTTIGRLLAEQLWKTFADVDHEIMKRYGGLNVAQIWQQHGEPDYRRVEGEVTQALCAK